jgi:hypothetical protein
MSDPSDLEFERDREAFYAAFDMIETLGDDAPVRKAIMAVFEVTLDFLRKYRDRMEASGIDVDDFLSDIAAQSKVFDSILAREEKANDAYLESLARKSEAAAKASKPSIESCMPTATGKEPTGRPCRLSKRKNVKRKWTPYVRVCPSYWSPSPSRSAANWKD